MPRAAKPWFRIYSDALDSRKLQRLKPALKWTWFNLMCLANVTRPRGGLPSVTDIAYRLRMSERQVQTDLRHLVVAGLIDEGSDGLTMHDWDEWQKDSDVRGSVVPDSGPLQATLRPANADVAPTKRRNSVPLEERRVEEKRKRGEEEEKRAPSDAPPEQVLPAEQRNIYRETERMMNRSLSAIECDSLRELEQTFDETIWRYAIREAADLNKRSIRYVQRVCENNANGVSDERTRLGPNSARAPEAGDAAAVYAAVGIRNLPVYLTDGGAEG